MGQVLFDLSILTDATHETPLYLRTNLIQISFRYRLKILNWEKNITEIKEEVSSKLSTELIELIFSDEIDRIWKTTTYENSQEILRVGLFNKYNRWYADKLSDEEHFYDLVLITEISFENGLYSVEISQESSDIQILSKEIIHFKQKPKKEQKNNYATANQRTPDEIKILKDSLKTLRELGVNEDDDAIKILKKELGETDANRR